MALLRFACVNDGAEALSEALEVERALDRQQRNDRVLQDLTARYREALQGYAEADFDPGGRDSANAATKREAARASLASILADPTLREAETATDGVSAGPRGATAGTRGTLAGGPPRGTPGAASTIRKLRYLCTRNLARMTDDAGNGPDAIKRYLEVRALAQPHPCTPDLKASLTHSLHGGTDVRTRTGCRT